MAGLDETRRQQGLAPLPFGVALHLGEMLWGNIGAGRRLGFSPDGPPPPPPPPPGGGGPAPRGGLLCLPPPAPPPAVNLVSRLEGLCRPLDKPVLVSGAFAAETGMPLIPLGAHALRGIASPCAVFTVPES